MREAVASAVVAELRDRIQRLEGPSGLRAKSCRSAWRKSTVGCREEGWRSARRINTNWMQVHLKANS
jgi:hypothetical protein